MQILTIEKGIPVPQTNNLHGTLKLMEVGDSLYVERPTSKVTGYAAVLKKTHGLKFTVRKEGEGCRIWRIA